MVGANARWSIIMSLMTRMKLLPKAKVALCTPYKRYACKPLRSPVVSILISFLMRLTNRKSITTVSSQIIFLHKALVAKGDIPFTGKDDIASLIRLNDETVIVIIDGVESRLLAISLDILCFPRR